ncbi:gamma-glutamylcyclotransferase [Caldimonas tepidiphila]|uniref:gamma-glutamylcyclotransferase n=1 Tax=Caldimonas tepidiphila TaxID=2315841 RepID=UPI000E5AB565|nr:gamma-glutamylcyclotransferase [Caldimonas tepidiphila]
MSETVLFSESHELVPLRDPAPLLARTLAGWRAGADLWVFGYGSLIWRPEFEHVEQRLATVHGYHRALKMWSRVNRGTPQCPGLVFALLSGGSCRGMVFRIPAARAEAELQRLWQREMPTGVYDPRWLPCRTAQGPVQALAFTLSRRSPNYTGTLAPETLQRIFSQACGRYGSTLDYVMRTEAGLRAHGIHDRALTALLRLARDAASGG